jgi:putative solute:sodium symporter small subunit
MPVDPTPAKAENDSGAGQAPEETSSATESGEHWSPWSTRTARWSWGLMAVFSAIYFIVAILTSKEAAELAATMVLGLPLGFWLGMGLIISGLVITRIYLTKVES